MDKLIDYLLQFGELNKQQIKLVEENVSILKLDKDAYLSEAGKTVKRFCLVKEGILRVCYYNKNGEEITRYFIDEGNLATDLNSFNNSIPSTEYVQAIIETELYVFTKENLLILSNTIIHWDIILNKITNKALLEKVNRISPMLAEDAKTRYLEFHRRFPRLANRIPLSHLATYIGITKQSLSRIRSELSKE